MFIRIFIAGVLSILPVSSAIAGVVPGKWEKVDRLGVGTSIVVQLKSGERVEAQLAKTDADSLTLTVDKSQLVVPKSEIQMVTRAEKTQDRVLNGVLIGTAVGFGIGFGGMAIFNARETATGPIWYGEAVGQYVSVGLLGAGIGALTGWGVDAALDTQEELYREASTP